MNPPPWSAALLLLLLLPAAAPDASEDGPVVKVSGGDIVGRIVEHPDAKLTKYYAFEGIPYARPPTGERRFKEPEDVEPWSGLRNATAPGSTCLQKDILFTSAITGDEDCLFINVYTADPPESWSEMNRPVAVYIHGGAFVIGSGNFHRLRPDPILRQGVVLVSFNYRLGVLGFLNTEDNEAPGNAGLKDAVHALRWVQKNIKMFGGNPEQVTIFGESAGAAMVHYLLLTPLTKGLVHGAIAMSGDALCPWARIGSPRRNALALRQHFAHACPDDAPNAVLPCLQRVDAKTLVLSQDKVPPEELNFRFWKNAFLPSVEAAAASDAPLLTEEPDKLMKEGNFLKIPFITGFTNAEGILYITFAGLFRDPSLWADVDERFVDKFRWEMPPDLRGADAINELRRFYMGDHAIRDADQDPEALRRFVQMTTDILFASRSVHSARLMAQAGAPVWVYEFTHEGPTPTFKTSLYNASHVPGVAHGEDLTYTFEVALRPFKHREPPADVAVRERRVRLFMDFAKTGNPTPEGSEQPIWPRYSEDNETYMEMGTEFVIKEHVLGDRVALWRRLAKVAGTNDEQPIVRLQEGELRGRVNTSAAGCTYYSFQGVRYAKAPVGPLRFKDSQPPEPWQGVRDALSEGNFCLQQEYPSFNIVGNEDCLFLNVYTPRRPTSDGNALPVLMWIHGGGFNAGSGNSAWCGPDYFVCEDIILVTINYRLGPLGFLYLDEAIPGNAGLKDQVRALRWVQKNIAAFGGDPTRVTIAGESAGGTAVHFLMLSPLTKGLFQRAIAQSGTAMAPYAFQPSNEAAEVTQLLASTLNCTDTDSAAIVECLRALPAEKLVNASYTKDFVELVRNRTITTMYVSVIDRPVPGVEAFLTDTPSQLIKKGVQQPVPFVIGFTSKEGLDNMEYSQNETIELEKKLETKFLPKLRVPANRQEEALHDLRQLYMDGKPLSNETLLDFLDLLTDMFVGGGVFYTLGHMVDDTESPLYAYIFSVDDELNANKIFFNLTDLPGATHADDLGYIFRMEYLPEVEYNSSASLARRRMVKLWSNFAKTGNPTPDEDPLLGVRWKAYTKEEHNYLDIGSDLTLHPNFYPERATFWEKFHDKFNIT